jgi:putative heme iron utilization protein
MTSEQLNDLRELLSSQRLLALSVLIDGAPYAGLLPYAFVPEHGAVLVHASRLARHTRGLEPGARFCVVIHRPDRLDADPLQVPRVTLEGTVEMLERGTDDYRDGQQRYLARFPSSEQTFQLGDFNLYRLRFEKGRYVGGFARAVNVTPQDVAQLT